MFRYISPSSRKVDPSLAAEVAEAFLATPSSHRHPLVGAAYKQLEEQSDDIFTALTQSHPHRGGIRFEFTRCRKPYDSDDEMVGAVNRYGLLEVSTSATEKTRRHPLMDCGVGRSYDRFRAVHDIVGHVRPRLGFDRDGEFGAWLVQERLYSGLARWALATELHAEHSVLWTTGAMTDHKAILIDCSLLTRVRRPLPETMQT
jgi:hypothetical protein